MNLKRISEIQQLPVMDLESGEILGEIISWTVHPLTGKVAAFVLEKPRLWKRARVLVPPDILEYGPRMVVVKNADAIIEPDEVVGLPELLTAKIVIVGYIAETETGRILGRVTDFVFEIIGSTIQQYYIRPSADSRAWQEDFILPAGRLMRIENNRLIFPDDVLSHSRLMAEPRTQTI